METFTCPCGATVWLDGAETLTLVHMDYEGTGVMSEFSLADIPCHDEKARLPTVPDHDISNEANE